MRSAFALAGLAAILALSTSALAAPVALAPVSYSPEFQAALDEDLGVREGEHLGAALTEAVRAALAERGASMGQGGFTIELTIVDADPNRPTMEQLADQPGLDAIRSISLGGAELHAVLRSADGLVVSEVSHRRYNHSIDEAAMFSPTTWSEARRAIRRFADRVADAYVAAAGN